jgi:hypothetical protein
VTDTLTNGGTEQSDLVTAVVNGVSLGKFDTWSGGEVMSKPPQHRAGGQKNRKSYPVHADFSNITVGRVHEADRDTELLAGLRQIAGSVPGSVTVQGLDPDGNAYGQSHTYTGLFLGDKGLKGDSSSEALQTYDLEFTVDDYA